MSKDRGQFFRWWIVLVVAIAIPAAAAAQEQVLIRMYTGNGEIYAPYLQMYQEANPHVQIETIPRQLDPDRLITEFATNMAPDVISIDVKFLKDFYRRGLLAPAPDHLYDRIQRELLPGVAEFVSYQGKAFAVPHEHMVTGVWFSRQALAAAGLPPEVPGTIDELEEAAIQLTQVDAEGNVTRPGITGAGGWAFNHFALAVLQGEGGNVLDAQGNFALEEPPLLRTIERLASWVNPTGRPFYVAEGFAFEEGNIGFGIGYPWWRWFMWNFFPDNAIDNFGVGLFPTSRDYGAFRYGHGYGVNAKSEHVDEVWKFLEWMTFTPIDDITPIGHALSTQGSLPNYLPDIQSPLYARERRWVEGFIANAAYARNTPDWEMVDIGKYILEVANGNMNPAEAVEAVFTDLRAALARQQE